MTFFTEFVFLMNSIYVSFSFSKGYLIKANYRKHVSVFLSSHTNTCGSLRENRNCVERLAHRACVRTQIFVFRRLPLNTENVLYFLNTPLTRT